MRRGSLKTRALQSGERVSLSEYSRLRGCSVSAVQSAVRDGRIQRDFDGLVHRETADLAWAMNTTRAKARKQRSPAVDIKAGEKRAETWATKQDKLAEQLDASKLGKLSFADARALKENFEAKMKFVQLQKAEGQLLDRNAVLADVQKVCRVTRDHLLNIPARVAAQVLALTELSDVEATIAEEITTALEDLADSLKRMAEGDPQ